MLPHKKVNIYKYTSVDSIEQEDLVVVEEPLELRLRFRSASQGYTSQRVAVTMRTPGDDEALVKGFLFTEGLINDFSEINLIRELEENIIEVELHQKVVFDPGLLNRNFYTHSSCGVCGKASIESVYAESKFLPWTSKLTIQKSGVQSLFTHFNLSGNIFKQTGGNHVIALADAHGKLTRIAEDVGRHNAMDKIIGKSALPLLNNIVLVSGRASFELVQKAAKCGIPIFLAIGAPSSLAITLAEEHGMTLVGFLKASTWNVYSGYERILE